jgi:DNA-binding LytR/AlgR family response regulator
MINFIICDDEEIFRESLKEKIDSCMMKTTIEYKTHFFDCYDKKFKDFTENINQFNVYFLDIITPHGTGMDAARYIRDKAGDWNSIIIFVTNYNEYRFKVLSSRLGVFDFIRKSPKALSRISDIMSIVISRYNTTSTKCITFEKDHSIFKIKYKDIIYIERELNSKSCIPLHNYIIRSEETQDDFYIHEFLSPVFLDNFQYFSYIRTKHHFYFLTGHI